MSTKKVTKHAKALGWIKERNGSKHQIWRHATTQEQITIPYQVRSNVVPRIMEQLAKKAACAS